MFYVLDSARNDSKSKKNKKEDSYHGIPRVSFPPDPINHVCSLHVNRSQKWILLIIQYKCTNNIPKIFIFQNLILRTKLCYTGFIPQPSWFSDFNLTESVIFKWFVLAVYQFWSFEKAFRLGRTLNILHDSHRSGQIGAVLDSAVLLLLDSAIIGQWVLETHADVRAVHAAGESLSLTSALILLPAPPRKAPPGAGREACISSLRAVSLLAQLPWDRIRTSCCVRSSPTSTHTRYITAAGIHFSKFHHIPKKSLCHP